MSVSLEREKEYYDPLLEMFQSRGWQLYLEDLKDDIENIANVMNLNSAEEFFAAKGMLNAMLRAQSYEDVIREEYAALMNDEEVI